MNPHTLILQALVFFPKGFYHNLMKIHLKSCPFLTSVVGIFFLVISGSCQSTNESQSSRYEVSLKADRTSLDELRKDIPPEKKQENDELALILQIMNSKNRHPLEIREKFNSIMRKKREQFSKAQRKAREDFSQQERQEREKFNKEQQELSDRFYNSKPSSEERRSFLQEHSIRRERFYTYARDRRKAFEEEMRDKERNFSALVEEKTKEFEAYYKNYFKEYKERMELNAIKNSNSPVDKKLEAPPAQRLESGE